MSKLYLLSALGVGIYIFLHSRWARPLRDFWKKFTPSNRSRFTMFDVRQCILEGEKEIAIQIYSELFKTSQEEARIAVDQLEKSIHEKN